MSGINVEMIILNDTNFLKFELNVKKYIIGSDPQHLHQQANENGLLLPKGNLAYQFISHYL